MIGVLGRNRTYDARLRTAALYPLSYEDIMFLGLIDLLI
jgi:hypothetical protein